jgi:predicted dienelactone hydrolase
MKNILLSFLFLFLVLSGFQAQFAVGHATITFNDPARTGGFGTGGGTGRQIQTEIYYPAVSAGNNVAASNGVFPVIVFGHGFVMSWDAYQNIWEHYASLGYIVAFPRTEGTFSPSHGEFGMDLRLVVQKVQELNATSGSILFGKIHPNSAIIGHSMGGGATILAAENNSSIKTIVGLAPANTTPSAISAAVNVTVPALIFSGSQDGVTPAAVHHTPIYQGLNSSCKTFVSILGGGHCYYANSNFNCDFGETTSSTGISITRAQQQERTYSVLDPWLDYTLRENCAAYPVFVTAAEATSFLSESNCSAGLFPVISESFNTLTSSVNGISYQWYLNGNMLPNSNTIAFTATEIGSYTVEVTFENNCSETSLPFILSELGSKELWMEYTFHPNPTTDFVNFTNPSMVPLTIQLLNLSGEVVSEQKVLDKIDLRFLVEGIYFFKIEKYTYKIVKQ